MRAPCLMLRAASALAALEGRDAIEPEDLSTAARLVLSPRATRLPPQPAPDEDMAEPEREPDDAEAEADTGDDVDPETEQDAPEMQPGALDDLVLEAAMAASARYLITFNVRHFHDVA